MKNYTKIFFDLLLTLNIFLIIFSALAIYTYSPSDPSLSNTIVADFYQPAQNIFGITGAYFADLMGTIFGCASLILPICLLFLLYTLFKIRLGHNYKTHKIYLLLSYSLILMILLSFLSGFLMVNDCYFNVKSSGGLLGILAQEKLKDLLGIVGGIITNVFALILVLMVMFHITIFDIPKKIYNKIFIKVPKKKHTKNDKKKITTKNIDDEYISAELKRIKNAEKISIKPPKTRGTTDYGKIDSVAYILPLELLDGNTKMPGRETDDDLKHKANLLEKKLKHFGVDGHVKMIRPGPVVTLFEFEPASGIKINKVTNLENDIAMAMSALSVRIIAPIPGKSVIGIELPNKIMSTVFFKDIIASKEFSENSSFLTIALGMDIAGKAFISDLAKMPHLLIAGTTGSGKSVSVNSIICSIIYKSPPDLVKFIMVDPKMVELSAYENIPHLAAPVVIDPKKATTVLKNVVREMENRYQRLAENKVKNIDSYNNLVAKDSSLQKIPYLVVVVDEFADLMIVSGKEVEMMIIRLSQMARAVGIHLILATQRPSVNVITGIIKANMPARLSFKVSSKTDSRTILDQNGAELLLGKGDSLFIPPGTTEPVRVHGCFISEHDINNVVTYVERFGKPDFEMNFMKEQSDDTKKFDEDEMDEKYSEALELVKEKNYASISMIQRYLRIGYNRAARIVEVMEHNGIIAPSDGTSKPREILRKE